MKDISKSAFELSPKRRALLEALLQQEGLASPASEKIPRKEPDKQTARSARSFPLSFAQERLWFLDQLVPNNAFYNIDTCLRLSLAIDHSALERSLNEIVRRHETLRTTFKAVDGQPMQIVAPALYVPLPVA